MYSEERVSTGSRGSRAPRPPREAEHSAFAGDRSFVMSFARGVAVLRAFAGAARPQSIADLSQRSGIPRAAVRRLLHTLAQLGYVRADATRYVLTPKTLEFSHAFSSSCDIAVALTPIIGRLSESLHAFSAVLVLENDEAMVLCSSGATSPMERHLMPTLGAKMPLYACASGLMFLAQFDATQLETYFSRVQMRPLTCRTPIAREKILDSLNTVRAQRYALCDRVFHDHLRSVAVPITTARGSMVAAITVVCTAERMNSTALHERLLPEIRRAAGEARSQWR